MEKFLQVAGFLLLALIVMNIFFRRSEGSEHFSINRNNYEHFSNTTTKASADDTASQIDQAASAVQVPDKQKAVDQDTGVTASSVLKDEAKNKKLPKKPVEEDDNEGFTDYEHFLVTTTGIPMTEEIGNKEEEAKRKSKETSADADAADDMLFG